MALITRETAKAFQAKSVQSRLANKYLEPDPPALPQVQPQLTGEVADEIALTRQHMLDCHAALTRAKDHLQWDALTRSYERLFKCWVWLANIPGPGQFKPEGKPASKLGSLLGLTLPVE